MSGVCLDPLPFLPGPLEIPWKSPGNPPVHWGWDLFKDKLVTLTLVQLVCT